MSLRFSPWLWFSQGRCMSAARPRHTRPIARWILRGAQGGESSCPLCAPKRPPPAGCRARPAGPSPRAAGPPFHVGGGSTGQSALPPPQRVAGSYPSFQPQGGVARGLAPGVPGHHGVVEPPTRPHDRRVRNVSPGNPTQSRWLETALFTAMAGNTIIL